jgi:hypothetical protein
MRNSIALTLVFAVASLTTSSHAAEGQEARARPIARWIAFDVNGDGRLDAEERRAWWAKRMRRSGNQGRAQAAAKSAAQGREGP